LNAPFTIAAGSAAGHAAAMGKTADALACKRLDLLRDFPEGLLAATLPVAGETE
jgi:hypothetical protein